VKVVHRCGEGLQQKGVSECPVRRRASGTGTGLGCWRRRPEQGRLYMSAKLLRVLARLHVANSEDTVQIATVRIYLAALLLWTVEPSVCSLPIWDSGQSPDSRGCTV
jgi:hypothetical protein